jgi:hypothetical protein
MPKPLAWTSQQDACLSAILEKPGGTLKAASRQMGVSRSFIQRRAALLRQAQIRSVSTKERELAGGGPLPAGHPITWGAINWITETRALVAMPGYSPERNPINLALIRRR